MNTSTYWPFAPLTQDLIDTTLKFYKGFGPDNLEYKAYLQSLDPAVGQGIEALYLMGRTIIPGEGAPDGDLADFLKDAQGGGGTDYLRSLRRTDFIEMVNCAITYLKEKQGPSAHV